MADIILVNFRNERDMYPPFGIMYVADALMQQGHRVELWHEPESRLADLTERMERVRPLWVGFSAITGPQLLPTLAATRRAHALGLPTVWGGVHATIMPEAVLSEAAVDFVVVNEGEITAAEFTRQLSGNRDWGRVAGLAWRDERGRIIRNPPRPFIDDLDRFAPRWDLLPDIEPYLLQSGPYERAIPVYISRGCPFRCGFCYNEIVMKRIWRQHSQPFILNQIERLRRTHGINAIDFADDYLFGRPRPMKRLVEAVGMPWSGQVRVQLLKPAFIRWMKETGCQWINIGAESGSQKVLDSIQKDQQADMIEAAVQNLAEYAPDIEANLSFIVGLPAEDRRERQRTIELIDRLSRLHANTRCSVSIYMPYPGTPLWPEALARGFVPPETQAGWARFDLDRANIPWIDRAEAETITEIGDILYVGRSRGHWILRPYYALLRWRWLNQRFGFYWEGRLKRLGAALIERVGPLRALRDRYGHKLVTYNANTHKGQVSP